VPLFRHLGTGTLLPLPEIQIIGGGVHAHWRTDVQDFLVVAPGAPSFAEALRWTWDVYQSAGRLMATRAGGPRGVADEGGHWPEVDSNEQAIELLTQAILDSGHRPGDDIAIALDIAASNLFDESSCTYRLRLDHARLSSAEMVERIVGWCERYPIRSVEDPLADTDWDAWHALRRRLQGRAVQVVGDDLFTTSPPRIRDGIARGAANAVLIKPNQVGTVTETIEAIRLTQSAGLQPIVSARSGETEDAFISHLAVATDAGELKVGSIQRSERNAKWNEVLRIGRTLGPTARWTPRAVFPPPADERPPG
jgi:enolase